MLKRREAFLGLAGLSIGAACGPSGQTSGAGGGPAPKLRQATIVVPGQPTRDGAGVRLSRTLGTRLLPMLDPFLMLDAFASDDPNDYIKGFPNHPHRGFETVTYMLEGLMEHQDSMGNRGVLRSGSVQWMTAGRGIIHSEMPKQSEGRMFGFQLWVNLPKAQKLIAPRYQDIPPADVPEVSEQGARVRLLAGAAGGALGPVRDIVTMPTMMDVALAAGQRFERQLDATQNAFVQVIDGAIAVGDARDPLTKGALAVLGPGEGVALTAAAAPARLLLLSANPIGEPVARRGPFVMNTEQELDQAFADYRAGTLVGG